MLHMQSAGRALDLAWPALAKAICEALLSQDVQHRSLKWMAKLARDHQLCVLECCTEPLSDASKMLHLGDLDENERSHLLMLRGLLAFKILLHCLQKRHNVDYGITDRYGLLPCFHSADAGVLEHPQMAMLP